MNKSASPAITAILALVTVVASGSPALAQAWLPQKGQASVTLYYSYIDVGNHLFSGDVIDGDVNFGKSVDFGDIRAHAVNLNVEYGISNRLAVTTVVPPAIVSRYKGDLPDNAAVDDGVFRGGFQDFRFQARYMAIATPFVLTPFVSVTIPSRDYETLGHTAVGQGLKKVHVGVFAGKLMDFISNNLYAQAAYGYSYAEKHLGMRTNRSNLNATLGYFVTPAVSISSTMYYQRTYGGLDWLDPHTNTEEGFNNHDRFSADNHLNLDGTIAVSASDAFDFFVSYTENMWGENTHQIRSITLGSTWSLWIGQ